MNKTNDKSTTLNLNFTKDHEYEVKVVAVGPDGTKQPIDEAACNTITIQGKLDTPDSPSGLTTTGFLNAISLSWTNPLDYDLDHVEIWRSDVNSAAFASKIAEVKGVTYLDTVGTPNLTYYYWIEAINTSGTASGLHPSTTEGVSGTSLGVEVTDIDDFAIDATKMFINTIILSADVWTDNSPDAGKIAWNAHTIVYNGASYPITAGNTALKYVYWTVGSTTYSASATHPALGTTAFMIATNAGGIHTLVWNNSANMVIGSAFIMDLDVDKLVANAASTNEFVSNTAQIKNGIINDAKITGTLTVGHTDAKCTDPDADQTSANPQPVSWLTDAGAMAYEDLVEKAKLGTTIVEGGYIKTDLLTADNIVTGTLTGRVVQTAVSGQRVVVDSSDNTIKFYDSSENIKVLIDDLSGGFVRVGQSTGADGESWVDVESGKISIYDSWVSTLLSLHYYKPAYPGFYDLILFEVGAYGNTTIGSSEQSSTLTLNGDLIGKYITTEKYRISQTTGNITTVGTVDGVDISSHDHTGVAGHGVKITHSNLDGIGANDHHSESHSLGSHNNVDIVSPANGDVLEYSIADSKWHNVQP